MQMKCIDLLALCRAMAMDYKILGSHERNITIPAPISRADEDSVTFYYRKTSDYLDAIGNSKAGVIICSSEFIFTSEDYSNKTLVLVADPRLAFIRIMKKLFTQKIEYEVHPTAIIDRTAILHPDISIGPNSYIEKCKIGQNCIIHANVHVYPNVIIGRDTTICDGTVIGKEGTSFARNDDGGWEKFPQIGGVVIGDGVDIGVNVVIERGTFDNTEIGQFTKIYSLSRIGHNVVIGKNCFICDHSYIGGNTKIGDACWLAPGAIVRNGLSIGSNVIVGMGAVVTKDVQDDCTVTGIPARVVAEKSDNTWMSSGFPTGVIKKQ